MNLIAVFNKKYKSLPYMQTQSPSIDKGLEYF